MKTLLVLVLCSMAAVCLASGKSCTRLSHVFFKHTKETLDYFNFKISARFKRLIDFTDVSCSERKPLKKSHGSVINN